MGKRILDLSRDVPVAADELAEALYDVRSAGISAAKQFDVLKTAAKLATAGLATTKEATDLLTSAINVYADETHDANKIANILFKTVKYGKTTIAGLAQGFGKVAAIAKEVGISLEDLSAATAILTTGGITASEAQTALKAAISNILKPTKAATETAEKLGIQFDLAALQAKGLSGMLVEITEKAGGNKQAIADLFGSVEAANAMFALASEDGAKKLNDILKDMNSNVDALQEGFDKATESTENQYRMLKNNLNVVMIELGTKILPIVIDGMKALLDLLSGFERQYNKIAEAQERQTEAALKLIKRAREREAEGDIEAAERLRETARSIMGQPIMPKKKGSIFSILSGISSLFKIRMQEGGVVPGPKGKPVPILAHAGETIIPADKKVGNIFNFNFAGAFIGNKEALIEEIKRAINRESELRALAGT